MRLNPGIEIPSISLGIPSLEDAPVLQKEETMPITSPWHSVLRTVHHNNTNCNTGNNIERENRRSGTGGKPLCSECAGLR